MSIIKVDSLTKEFKVQKRKGGFTQAVKDLFSREYETKKAVDNISFEIEAGEIVGYIGPNGAGKSTTIKMLVGILVPTSGYIEVNGLVPHKERIENAKKMGVVFGQRTQLWWDIPVSESLNLMKYMYKIPEKQYKENLDIFSDILELNKFINTPVRQLSLGQRMRADLCAALLHNPDIIYLDEPTIGLDVVVKEKIRDFLKQINQMRKTTIMLTTHDMSDVEKLCSRVMVIDNGKAVYDGSLEKLRLTYGSEELITIDIENKISDLSWLYEIGVKQVAQKGNKLIINYDKGLINSTAVISRVMEKTNIKDLVIRETEIEEVIRRMYKSQVPLPDECEKGVI